MLWTKRNPTQNLAQFSLLRHNLSLKNSITRWVVFISSYNVKKFWTYSVFSAHRLTTWMDYKTSSISSESHSALWHNLTQFKSIHHPVHYRAQYGLVWHIIKAAYLNPNTKTSLLVQFEKIQLNLPQFCTIVHHTSQNLCCRTDSYAQNWVLLPNLGGFSTMWHFNISFWGKYMTKLQNAPGKWNENPKLTLHLENFQIWKHFQE